MSPQIIDGLCIAMGPRQHQLGGGGGVQAPRVQQTIHGGGWGGGGRCHGDEGDGAGFAGGEDGFGGGAEPHVGEVTSMQVFLLHCTGGHIY